MALQAVYLSLLFACKPLCERGVQKQPLNTAGGSVLHLPKRPRPNTALKPSGWPLLRVFPFATHVAVTRQ